MAIDFRSAVAGLTPTVAESPGDGACPRCEGRGWLLVADGGAGSARPCACRAEGRTDRLLAAAGIPDKYQTNRLENFSTVGNHQLRAALADSQRYVETFVKPNGQLCESGLLFVGPPGTGKTHLAVAILHELIVSLGVRGRFVDFTALIYQIQSSFDPSSPESQHRLLDPVVDADLLVLDELGAQKPTPWVRDVLYLVINGRYSRRRPTLFTTNYRLGTPPPVANADGGEGLGLLVHRVSPAIVSRLQEMTDPVDLTAVDDHRSQR